MGLIYEEITLKEKLVGVHGDEIIHTLANLL